MAESQEILFVVKADNKQAVDALRKLQLEVDGIKEKTKKMASATQQSNMMLQSTGRIVQDLPFGMMGIANNIQFLAEQMTYAKSQGQSMGSIFKGLASSMMGAGGVMFAISAVTSALTYLSMQSSKTENKLKGLTESLKDNWSAVYKSTKEWEKFGEELDKFKTADLIESLNTVNRQMKELRITAIDGIMAFLGFYGSLAEVYGELAKLEKQASMISQRINTPKMLGWDDVPKAMQDKWKSSFNKKDPQGFEGQADVLKMLEEQLERTRQKYIKFYETVNQISEGTYFKGKVKMKGVNQPNKPGPGFTENEIRQQFIDENAFFVDTVLSSADIIRGEFMQVWIDVFGEANSLFEKLIANWVDRLATFGLNQLGGMFLNFLVPGLGSMLGMAGSPQIINVQLGDETLARAVVKGNNTAQRLRLN